MHLRTVGLFVLLVACSSGCDGGTMVSGRVVDIADKPIDGATVRVDPAEGPAGGVRSHEAVTDGTGNYTVDFTHAPRAMKFKVTTTHSGYLDTVEVLPNGQHPDHTIRLQPDKKPKGERGASAP
jgi:hypothetical protein